MHEVGLGHWRKQALLVLVFPALVYGFLVFLCRKLSI
jgi:hypothetical protein